MDSPGVSLSMRHIRSLPTERGGGSARHGRSDPSTVRAGTPRSLTCRSGGVDAMRTRIAVDGAR